MLGIVSTEVLADISREMAGCAKIVDDGERLKCYDELSGRKAVESPPMNGSAEKAPEEKSGRISYFSQLWELDKESSRGKYVITPHRSNYMLPFTFNESPNTDSARESGSNKDMKKAEVKFQLSFKVKLWQDILDKEMDLWVGYTQQSFWQFYDFEDSSPFRETNYEPELLLNFKTDYNVLGFKGRFINVGLNHQSNGRSELSSRSWNRIVTNLGLEKNNFSLLLKGWYRIPEAAQDDDNPNIEDYLGYGEVWGYYFWKKHRFGVMLRDNLKFPSNRGAVQLEWSFPMIERVSGYVQYFNGYGENLLDYRHNVNRIGIGFILTDWN
ncbi:MAG: phospholipase A [Deltaproteobacteria bacterium]|nr:phospholipase A [Deltaproteobacteria bacterium]